MTTMSASTSDHRIREAVRRGLVIGAALAVLVTLLAPAVEAAVTRVELDASVQANATSTTKDAAGNPVVVYNDFNREQMHLVRCADPGCGTVGPVRTPDPRKGTGRVTSVAVGADDVPVVAYFLDLNETGGGVVVGGIPNDVVLARCADPSCSSATTVTLDGSHMAVGGIAVFLDDAGNPTVVYGHREDGTVVLRCDDALCDGDGETRTSILPDSGVFGAALDPSGNPVVALDGTVVHCNDPGCTGGDEATAELESLFNSPGLVVDGAGNPVVVGRSASGGAPVVVRCDDPACASRTETELSNAQRQAPDVTLNAQGNPIVSVDAENGASLGVIACTTPTCTGAEVPVPLTQPNTGFAHLDIAPDGRLVVITDDRLGNRRPLALTCDDAACTVGTAPPTGGGLTAGQEAAIAHAIAISQERFGESAPNSIQGMAVIATVEGFPDALAGTGLLGSRPMLLTGGTTLHPDVVEELIRLNRGREGGRRIYLLGGTAALSEGIETSLGNGGWTVLRLAGDSRIETSGRVASEIRARDRGSVTRALARAFAAEGNPTSGWADSITYGGYAAEVAAQVILAPPERGHPTPEHYIGGEAHEVLHLVGGPAAVPSSYDDAQKAERVEGTNRFDTARQIAVQLWQQPEEGERTYLVLDATQELGWAYGLPAAGLSADLDAPVLAVGATVPPETLQAVAGCDDQVELRAIGPVAEDVMAELDDQDAGAC